MTDAGKSWIDENGIINHLAPVEITLESIDKTIADLTALAAQSTSKNLLVDFSESNKPSVDVRNQIKSRAASLIKGMHFISVCTGNNILVNVAAQFFIRSSGFKNISLCQTREEAMRMLIDFAPH